ncbi:MAG TPA: DNA polymerase III subunit gamma/tau [Clostridiaceae bacterium]|nr:DNA polymerase III subunit gamma/tau [Clostridiaceae bacterium]
MGYTALYRKFRPLNFSEMVGQEHITRTLRNQVIEQRVGHAYLFNGGRGTGKTSAAKILARAVNCLNPKDGEPCNECEICKAILSGSLTDVVEMDAASNNSVEDIRAIRDEVNFLPTRAKYRVYIIDEVHMLSTGAFNALLKTLEEPPEHVKFILATTEPQKLPATILSRCQRFDFKRISTQDIIKRLGIICKESNIQISKEALELISILSEGAMRDAISILERCAAEQTEEINEDKVRDLVGIPKITYINKLAKGIINKEPEEAINIVNTILEEGKDIDNFLWELIKYIKDILVYKSTSKLEVYNQEEIKNIKELADSTDKERLLRLIYELSELANNIKWSSQKAIMFEAGIIKACMEVNVVPQNVVAQEQVVNRKQIAPVQKQENIAVAPKERKIEPQNQRNSAPSASYWNNVINKVKQSGKMAIYVNLIGSKASQLNDMTVEVELANRNDFGREMLEKYENKALVEKFVSEEMRKSYAFKIYY